MKPLKILILEDNESDAGLIRRVLKKANVDFEYRLVDTKEEFINGLDLYKPDVIFSDHSLPQFNSLEAFSIFKNKKLNIPFILVTGTVSEEFAVKCLQEGIDDYILKDHLARLPSALENALYRRRIALEKQQLEKDQISYMEKIKAQNQTLIKINNELDRLVYSASHELKAPLMSILGLVYLIQMDIAEGRYVEIEEYLQLIRKSVDKLLHTIEEIIFYTINSRSKPKIELIEINEIINSIWEKLKYMEGASQIVNKIKIEQNWPWYSDKNRIMIILENLISNAIKFRDNGKKTQLIIINIVANFDNVKIIVQDNGVGIQEKHMDKIFNMYYRASALSEGPGLGLYLVKETTEKIKGKVDVRSEFGKGTTFTLEIPNNSEDFLS